jgi:hypothetical protein
VAAVPSGLSLTPLRIIKIKCDLISSLTKSMGDKTDEELGEELGGNTQTDGPTQTDSQMERLEAISFISVLLFSQRKNSMLKDRPTRKVRGSWNI